MRIDEQVRGAVTFLRPDGAIAQQDSTVFRRALMQAVRRSMGRCVVDASAVPFMDSAALESLLDATDELAVAGRVLRLCGLNETVRECLELTGISGRFDIYADGVSAARSFL
ncbi:MAG: STAS domain-containing protein [Phycisphaeraceae bacterium]|nr:STAS domain-containing protein [Phycisphaeraceae bacterium]